jgi:hypothetical protein
LLSQTEHQFKVLQIGFISKESLGAVRDILKNVLTLLETDLAAGASRKMMRCLNSVPREYKQNKRDNATSYQ